MLPPPIDTAATPDPSDCTGVVLPYPVVNPYSKLALVAEPFGLAVPFSVALFIPIPVAVPVTTVGGVAAVSAISHKPRPCVPAPRIPRPAFNSISNTWAVGRLPPKRLHVAPSFVVTYTPSSLPTKIRPAIVGSICNDQTGRLGRLPLTLVQL